MDEFHDSGKHLPPLAAIAAQIGGYDEKKRAQALATAGDDVGGDSGNEIDIGAVLFLQVLLDNPEVTSVVCEYIAELHGVSRLPVRGKTRGKMKLL
jgi:hypothetical protein